MVVLTVGVGEGAGMFVAARTMTTVLMLVDAVIDAIDVIVDRMAKEAPVDRDCDRGLGVAS
jgi:hypothetical protein